MSEFELCNTYIPQSEEVDAYPYVLRFVSVNWVACALENPDSKRKEAFALAAAYSDLVVDDLMTCRMIARVSGIQEGCSRQHLEGRENIRPRNF